jgi:hypothetical protein
MASVRYPSLYQINTRAWLTELSGPLGPPTTLDAVPDAELDRLAQIGFDWVWFLSVWQTGPAGRQVSRSNAGWRKDFQETTTSAVPASPSPTTLCIRPWAAMRPWPGCVRGRS